MRFSKKALARRALLFRRGDALYTKRVKADGTFIISWSHPHTKMVKGKRVLFFRHIEDVGQGRFQKNGSIWLPPFKQLNKRLEEEFKKRGWKLIS